MIAYSIPLRCQGRVYGVLGVEISSRQICDYFPVAELNEEQESGYLLALRDDGQYRPLVGKGALYSLLDEDGFTLRETRYRNLFGGGRPGRRRGRLCRGLPPAALREECALRAYRLGASGAGYR